MPVDPETLGRLMLETKRVNDNREGWIEMFGFAHNCRCDQDYAEENMGEVTDCWAGMAQDALATCKTLTHVLRRIASGDVEDAAALAQEYVS